MGRVTMRSVLLPVQEGFASVVLARRGSSRIPRAAMALPGLCRVCVCPSHQGHPALFPTPASETQAQGRMGDRRKAVGVAPGRCWGLT